MKILIKNKYKKDFKTREAGERLRNEIISSLKSGEKVLIDFEEVMVASISFFDEGFAKLNLTTNEIEMITIKNIFRRDLEVLKTVCQDRKFKIEKASIIVRLT